MFAFLAEHRELYQIRLAQIKRGNYTKVPAFASATVGNGLRDRKERSARV